MPRASIESKELLDYLLRDYQLSREDDVVELSNATYATLQQAFTDLKTKLIERHKQRSNTLVFHIFSGHSVVKDGLLCVVLNQPDTWVKDEDPKRFEDYNCFY